MNSEILRCVRAIAWSTDSNSILLVQRSLDDDHLPGYWECAGGKAENPTIPLIEELSREIQEETQAPFKLIHAPIIVVEQHIPFTVKKYQGWKALTTFFQGIIETGIQLSGEHQNYCFVSPDKAFEYKLTSATRLALKRLSPRD